MLWTIENWDTIPDQWRGKQIRLLTIGELQTLKRYSPHTPLVSISGRQLCAGDDAVDFDHRAGFSAYAIRENA